MLHAHGELNRAKVRVAAGTEPWLSGWNRLTANRHSASTWAPNPQKTIIRGGTGENSGILYNDILTAWSAPLTTLTGNADRFLAAGLYGYQFANAAELMRGYSGFDLGRFQTM